MVLQRFFDCTPHCRFSTDSVRYHRTRTVSICDLFRLTIKFRMACRSSYRYTRYIEIQKFAPICYLKLKNIHNKFLLLLHQYWPHPERFDPERFSAKNKANIVPYSYLPFGEGPHNCIGNRFGNLQARLGFVNFFRNHRVAPSERTPERAKFDRLSMIIQMDGGVHLNVIRDPL